MAEIREKHEVAVRSGDRSFVFEADPDAGRLVIREEGEDGEVCALTIGDSAELAGFIEGLRRVFRSTGLLEAAGLKRAPRGEGDRDRLPPGGGAEPDREELAAQARRANPQAFQPWSREEEAEVRLRYERGEPIASIARDRQRSPRAIEMRLKKLGAVPP